jgi:hypothetical protein
MIFVIYLAIKDDRDGVRVSWNNILILGLVSIVIMIIPILKIFLGLCRDASWLEILRLIKRGDSTYCSVNVGMAYGMFVATFSLVLWNGVVWIFRTMQFKK